MMGFYPVWIELIAAFVLIVIVAAISYVDFRKMRIPNVLVIALAGFGLAFQFASTGQFPILNLVFAVGVGSLFWLMRYVFFKLKGQPGLGLGDVKMAAACGVWINPWFFSVFLLIASLTCIVYAGFRAMIYGRQTLGERIPFGPFLGIGLIAIWFFNGFFGYMFA